MTATYLSTSAAVADTRKDGWPGWVSHQICPRSFQDSNGDGVGDHRGIRARLPHVASLVGVDAIWISPFFAPPMLDEHGPAAVGEVGEEPIGLELVGQYTSGDAKMHMSCAFEICGAPSDLAAPKEKWTPTAQEPGGSQLSEDDKLHLGPWQACIALREKKSKGGTITWPI